MEIEKIKQAILLGEKITIAWLLAHGWKKEDWSDFMYNGNEYINPRDLDV